MIAIALLFALRLTPSDTSEFKQPQLAESDKLVAVTFGSGSGIYYSGSRDGGQSFSKPLKVAELPGLLLGKHRGPRIAITRDAIVISAISNQQGDLATWRSMDQGRTWMAGAAANETPRGALEGLHAMLALPDGSLYAVWLDSPGKGKRLLGARSNDDGATWSKNIVVYRSPDGSICECCHPSLAAAADGTLHAMWRNSLAGDRDMYTAASHDGGRSFGPASKVGEGSWHLNACPMDGGGIAIMQNGQMAATFRRQQEVFLATEGKPEAQLAAGKDPAIAANADGVFVAWTTPEGVMAVVPGSREPLRLDPDGAFPQLVALPHGAILAAWERKGEIEFQRLTAGRTR